MKREGLKYRLLIIEKTKPTVTGEVIHSILAEEGFGVITCSDNLEAFARLDEIKPDLIILIEGLSADSFETCRRLRRLTGIPS